MNSKTILIADDDSDLVAVLAMRCRQMGLKVLVAYDGLTALSLIDEQSPDLVVLDVNMPLGDGFGVCQMLAPDEVLSSIPVIILTGRSDEDTVRRCRSLRAHYVLKSSDVWARVQPVIRAILESEPPPPSVTEVPNQAVQHEPAPISAGPAVSPAADADSSPDPHQMQTDDSPKTIIIADDDRDMVQVLALRCRQVGVRVVVAYDAMTALTLAREEHPDLICLDVNMPSGSGLSVCEMLTNDEELSSIPVIMLTGRTDEDTIRRCHSMCAYYVLKSSDIWTRVGPIVQKLLDTAPPESAALTT